MNNEKHTIEDAKKLAKAKNGFCLSETYTNNITKLEWKCNLGHSWKSSYASMIKNWCRECSKLKKKQKVINEIIFFSQKYNIYRR